MPFRASTCGLSLSDIRTSGVPHSSTSPTPHSSSSGGWTAHLGTWGKTEAYSCSLQSDISR